jgi:hypothetical protein
VIVAERLQAFELQVTTLQLPLVVLFKDNLHFRVVYLTGELTQPPCSRSKLS